MNNFWKDITKPVFALAPMEDVTDTAFRELVMRISEPGKLHILFTEFTSVDGMNHPVGRERVAERLVVTESERQWLKKSGVKLVAQIWGKEPELFNRVTKYITEHYNFDGIDINMGCPVKNVVKNGACSALIDQPTRAQEIVLAAKEATDLPVSVKTRTGIRQHDTERWITQLCEVKPAAITLHGRTQKMMSEKPADWNEVAKGAKVRNQLAPDIPFLGNGDVWSYEQGEEYCKTFGTDGIMIGRGIFHNPWFFNPSKTDTSKTEKLEVLLKHVDLYEAAWQGKRNFNILKRFFKIYANGFDNASDLRAQLMVCNEPDEVRKIIFPLLNH
ncbi:tRNA dihydrouridine synthase [Saccharicrinis sp. FJH2]|uniref:tRNA dihydrouridine synthase n=1 Tax=Saccharicrinis sp. FJH65 TaxID=3344659 RepID=UPI0035F43B26